MSPRSREGIHQIPSPLGAPGIVPRIGTVEKLGGTAGSPAQTGRPEAQVVENKTCSYQVCEGINEESTVTPIASIRARGAFYW
jgi:hypothetical protein